MLTLAYVKKKKKYTTTVYVYFRLNSSTLMLHVFVGNMQYTVASDLTMLKPPFKVYSNFVPQILDCDS